MRAGSTGGLISLLGSSENRVSSFVLIVSGVSRGFLLTGFEVVVFAPFFATAPDFAAPAADLDAVAPDLPATASFSAAAAAFFASLAAFFSFIFSSFLACLACSRAIIFSLSRSISLLSRRALGSSLASNAFCNSTNNSDKCSCSNFSASRASTGYYCEANSCKKAVRT